MRIHFTDRKRPKFVAKQVRDCLNLVRNPALPRVTLAQAQDVTARMFGYRHWHELDQAVGNVPATANDEDCASETVLARRAYQARAFCIEGVFPDEGRMVIETLMPSGRRPGKASAFKSHPIGAVASLDILDLKDFGAGDMLVMFKSEKVYARTFVSDPPPIARVPKLKLRAEHFIRIPKPDLGMTP